jgi:hypothetical protein
VRGNRAGLAALLLAAMPCGAATIVVTDASDALHADGCAATGTGACTLRDAITFANSRAGSDLIRFALPGGGAHVIAPTAALPKVTDSITIDGYSQAGARANTLAEGDDAVLLVELSGSGASEETDGLWLGASRCIIRGLVLTRFRRGIVLEGSVNTVAGNFIGTNAAGAAAAGNRETGVDVLSQGNTVGGTIRADRNVISGNGDAGVGLAAGNNIVVGNFIGINAAGNAALGNSRGVLIRSRGRARETAGNVIGGPMEGAGNVISGNRGRGIQILVGAGNRILGNRIGTDSRGRSALGNLGAGIDSSGGVSTRIGGGNPTTPEGPCTGACNLISGNGGDGILAGAVDVIAGNFIGTDVAGTASLPNEGTGVKIGDRGRVTVGGTLPATRNLISGNRGPGVEILGESSDNAVTGNFIGVNAKGDSALPNGLGVAFSGGAHGNSVGGPSSASGNVIAFNGGAGVSLDASAGAGNAILSNSIFENGGLGIDLGADGPTENDPSEEARQGPNRRQGFPVFKSITFSSIEGTLTSVPGSTFTLQFFASAACDPSGYGQGQTLIGSTTATTDAQGEVSFGISLTVPPGQPITATATDEAGDTSEFSPCQFSSVETPESSSGG